MLQALLATEAVQQTIPVHAINVHHFDLCSSSQAQQQSGDKSRSTFNVHGFGWTAWMHVCCDSYKTTFVDVADDSNSGGNGGVNDKYRSLVLFSGGYTLMQREVASTVEESTCACKLEVVQSIQSIRYSHICMSACVWVAGWEKEEGQMCLLCWRMENRGCRRIFDEGGVSKTTAAPHGETHLAAQWNSGRQVLVTVAQPLRRPGSDNFQISNLVSFSKFRFSLLSLSPSTCLLHSHETCHKQTL